MFCVLLFDGKINKKNAHKPNKCEINVFGGLIVDWIVDYRKEKIEVGSGVEPL